MNRLKKFLLIFSLLFIFSQSVFSQSNTEEKKSSLNFPQWALFVRRAEIVTLGSLPFTTMGTTLGFGAYQYFSGASSTFPNPFDKSSPSYSEDNIKTILAISFSISAVIGIVDLIISIVKYNNESKRLEYLEKSSVITVVEATEEEIENFLKYGSNSESVVEKSAEAVLEQKDLEEN